MKYYEKEEVIPFSGGKPFSAWIGNLGKYNEGELRGTWVQFPTDRETIDVVMKNIGIGEKDVFGQPYEEIFIGDYDCYVNGMSKYLGEYESLDELNNLAHLIYDMSDEEYIAFLAAIELGDNLSSVKDLINLTYSLDSYDFFPDIDSDKKLGGFWIEEYAPDLQEYMEDLAMVNYFDFDAFGKDIRISEGGAFTKYGYIANWTGDLEEVYSGDIKDIPEKYLIFYEPKNYLESAEVLLEDDYGMIDGIINNDIKESIKKSLEKAEEKSEKQSAKTNEKAKEEVCL